jgi:CubicO group peptidase (beta-lactamase class C family)
MKRLVAFSLIILLSLNAFTQVTLDKTSLEPFFDGVISSKLKDKNIAGATLSIVKDGEILLTKGYGYSDYDKRISVDGNETLFRIGSISKMFVWLAVMQQVERGKLDLNKDLNSYLKDFKIPNTFPEPITLKHLMSHTPGFEDKLIKLFTLDAEEIKPLSQVLANQVPKRVRPAGVHASYSNHGTAIAAHIVEVVSGLSWDEYVEQNIFSVLGMGSTTFRQPLPDSLQMRISKGYKYEKGLMTEKSFEYIPLSPAGAVTTSAKDMATFMLMLLENGQYQNSVILDSTTFNLMMTPIMYHAQGINPCRYGFMDVSYKGVQVIGHGGETFWFHSLMALVPEHNLGIFLSFNSDGGGGTYVDVFDAFLDNYLVNNYKPLPKISVEDDYLAQFAGEYMMNRYPHTDYLKLVSLMNRMTVSVEGERLKIDREGKTSYWIPVGALLFQKENEADILAFKFDTEGKISYAFDGRMAIWAFDKVSFIQQQVVHLGIILATIVLSLLVIVYWPLVFFVRRRYFPMSVAHRTLTVEAKVTAWAASFLLLAFYFGVSSLLSDVEASVYSVPDGLKTLLIVPFIIILLTLVMYYQTWAIWKVGGTRIRSRLFYTLLTITYSLALWQLYYWNFLGWNY